MGGGPSRCEGSVRIGFRTIMTLRVSVAVVVCCCPAPPLAPVAVVVVVVVGMVRVVKMVRMVGEDDNVTRSLLPARVG